MVTIDVNKTISVIMSVYNKSKYLEKSIKSILNQSYKYIHLIIIDDCSTDGSREIIEKYKQTYDNVAVIYNDKNMGCYVCRNIGLIYAYGKYITFHDADDYSVEHRFSIQINTMRRNKLLISGCNIVRSNFDVIPDIDEDVMLQTIRNQKNYEYFGYATLIYDRIIFQKCGNFIERRKGMDMEYGERILFKIFNIIFSDSDSWSYYNNEKNDIYEKMNMLMYICPKMDSNNITISIPDDEFLKNKKWRDNYRMNNTE